MIDFDQIDAYELNKKYKSVKLPLEMKNTQKNKTWRLSFIKSHHIPQC